MMILTLKVLTAKTLLTIGPWFRAVLTTQVHMAGEAIITHRLLDGLTRPTTNPLTAHTDLVISKAEVDTGITDQDIQDHLHSTATVQGRSSLCEVPAVVVVTVLLKVEMGLDMVHQDLDVEVHTITHRLIMDIRAWKAALGQDRMCPMIISNDTILDIIKRRTQDHTRPDFLSFLLSPLLNKSSWDSIASSLIQIIYNKFSAHVFA